jgi:hypothetical protein
MNRNGITILAALVLITLIAFAGILQPANAITPYERVLGSNSGFKPGTKYLSISSTAAVKLPDLPDGCHEFCAISANAFNYGDENVSTATTELFCATATVTVQDKFLPSDPDVYFRCRGTDTVATLTLQYR